MMSFLINNAGTVLTAAALLLAVFLVAGKMARDRKAGKGCCGGSCACCSGNCAGSGNRADSRNHTEGGHMPRRALAPGARQGEFMTTILTAYTLSECMELMAERAAAVEKTGGKNLIFCEDRLTLIAERALVAATGGTFSSSVTTFARYLGADGRILSKQGSVMAVGGIMAELQRMMEKK